MQLLDLPHELLLAIEKEIPSQRDLGLFLRVNRYLHSILDPELYRRDADIQRFTLWAARVGRLETLKKAQSYGIYSNRATGDLLCLSAENGHASVLKHLLPARRCDWGPRMPEFGCHLDKLLVRPSRNGHHAAVKVLLEHGADHSWANVKGRTALYHAATNGFSSVIEVLLDGGAEISAPDWHQWTPLHFACKHGHVAAARLLVNRGADISAKCNAGRSPIFNAVESNNLELAEFLLSKGCDPKSRENLGSTPLHRAVENGLYEMSKLLVRYGSQVDAEADSKTTVLDWAIRGRDVRVAIFILEALAKMPPANALGSSPLHLAAALGLPQAVKILIDKGYDVNLKTLDR
ncbi:hypothetical protein V494_08239 [Pseudogymnoascus sp. VKM F-4513 (FW-928)]|nr:hypothetical protein V494_08239 [Pseudogymnoascus sp. VKM F-4513 (FW-928)]